MPMKELKNSSLIPWLAAALLVPLALGGWLIARSLKAKAVPVVDEKVEVTPLVEAPPLPKSEAKAPAVAVAVTKTGDSKLFASKIHPFLTTYCITCHNDKKEAGGVSLERFSTQALAMTDRKIWGAAAEVLRAKEMPPKSRKQPSDAERSAFLAWVDSSLTRVDCGQAYDPGRPTIRRLNKAEYNNTIRDLVGVNFQPADDFPSDDVGYGFDNIGDVLAFSPILFEKYMSAAQKILEQAIVIPKPIEVSKDSFRPQNLRSSFGKLGALVGKRYPLNANGKVFVNFDFLHGGEYIIRGRASGEQAGSELPKMTFQVDGKAIKSVEVDAPQEKAKVYETRTTIAAGRHDVELAFTNYFAEGKEGDAKKRERRLFVEQLEIEGPFNPVPKSLPASHTKIMIAKPTGSGDKLASARKIIEHFATRAYRRPAYQKEVDRLLAFFKKADADGETFERSIQMALRAVLVSPHFLFRIEQDAEPNNPRAVHPVGDFELASRLSYFLWSSMPDERLFAKAGKGELRKPGAIEAEVKRMLADPKARALTDNFAAQWLNLRSIPALDPDPKTFPGFDASLKAAMVTETELYFEQIAKEDRSILEFLDSDWTFVNNRLAAHYGIKNVNGNEFTKVKLADKNRGGVLMQASVLTLTSNPTAHVAG